MKACASCGYPHNHASQQRCQRCKGTVLARIPVKK